MSEYMDSEYLQPWEKSNTSMLPFKPNTNAINVPNPWEFDYSKILGNYGNNSQNNFTMGMEPANISNGDGWHNPDFNPYNLDALKSHGVDPSDSGNGMDWLNFNNFKTGMDIFGKGAGFLLNLKQYNLAKNQLEENKRRYDQTYNIAKNEANDFKESRQIARVGSNPGYESVDSYMAKNRII